MEPVLCFVCVRFTERIRHDPACLVEAHIFPGPVRGKLSVLPTEQTDDIGPPCFVGLCDQQFALPVFCDAFDPVHRNEVLKYAGFRIEYGNIFSGHEQFIFSIDWIQIMTVEFFFSAERVVCFAPFQLSTVIFPAGDPVQTA